MQDVTPCDISHDTPLPPPPAPSQPSQAGEVDRNCRKFKGAGGTGSCQDNPGQREQGTFPEVSDAYETKTAASLSQASVLVSHRPHTHGCILSPKQLLRDSKGSKWLCLGFPMTEGDHSHMKE